MKRATTRKGFTLMELMVVILIIGVLAAFAIPKYLQSVETSKADDAAALLNMVATTNRMYALDHNGSYVNGTLDNSCNSGACAGDASSPCELVRCKYLASQDFNSKAWIVAADKPNAAATCTGATYGNPPCTGGACVACTVRKVASNCAALGGSPSACTTGTSAYAPYTGWGYAVGLNGQIISAGSAPTAVQP
jgi:prepilin-type N-terminal cleavage/methylation domain-containing protein